MPKCKLCEEDVKGVTSCKECGVKFCNDCGEPEVSLCEDCKEIEVKDKLENEKDLINDIQDEFEQEETF